MPRKKRYKKPIPPWRRRKYVCSKDGVGNRCYHTLAVSQDLPSANKLGYIEDLMTHEVVVGGRDHEDLAHVGMFESPQKNEPEAKLQPVIKPPEPPTDIFAKKSRWRINLWPRRSALAFASLLIVIILPVYLVTQIKDLVNTKDAVVQKSDAALSHLLSAQQAINRFDAVTAEREFAQAALNFQLAQNLVNDLDPVSAGLLKWFPQTNQPLSAGLNLLKTGENISLAAQTIAQGVNALFNSHDDIFAGLQDFQDKLVIAQPRIAQAQSGLQNLNLGVLPLTNQNDLAALESRLPKIQKGLDYFTVLSDAVLEILGHDQWRRYLIVFTNNNELRAVGGFMGSYALLDVDRGKIKNLEVPSGGTYDAQGSLLATVAAPKPLQLINSRWEFQDANWWPDFPTTARQVKWFYEKSYGATVDGVVLISTPAVEAMLDYIGPVALASHDTVVSADNLETELQQNIRLARDEGSSAPKQILSDLTPVLINAIADLNQDQMIKFLNVVYNQFKAKQILVNFSNPDLQEIVLALDYGGAQLDTEADYLMIVNSNIAGGKTDQVIERTYNHTAQVASDGTITNTLEITFEHHGVKGADIFTGVQNNNYLRVYVPLGSKLVSASGFERPDSELFESPPDYYATDIRLAGIEQAVEVDLESQTDIYHESNKTVFGNWLSVKPGTSQTVKLTYRLPFGFGQVSSYGKSLYSLLWQKQSGTLADEFSSQLVLPRDYLILNKYPDAVERHASTFTYAGTLLSDQFYGIIFDD